MWVLGGLGMKLTIQKTDHGFTVVCDDVLVADSLCPDEALGTVAVALFNGFLHPHRYFKTRAQWTAWEMKYVDLTQAEADAKWESLIRG
jgi:hypothetical protein